MTLHLLLAAAQGGGSFTPPSPPPPTPLVLVSAPNGGYNPWTIANAIQSGGKVFTGYIDGSNGNVEFIERDESTGVVTGPTLVKSALGADAHNSPALLVRSSDSKLVTVYCPHSQGNIYRRISTNALDSTAWGTESNLDSSLGGTRYTNPQLHQLNSETNDPVYLFFRNEPTLGTDSRWQLSKSTNGGSTFGAMANIYHMVGARSYFVTWSNGEDRIDCLVTGSFSTSPYKIGHFYYEANAWHKSDGTTISVPIQSFANVTELYSGTDVTQPGQVAIDGSGFPVVTFYTWNSTTHIYTYWYGRWDGAAWTVTDFATTESFNYNTGADDGVYGVAIDDADPDVVYGFVEVAGYPELFRWTTADGGATFTETQLTTATGEFASTPVPVRYRGSSLIITWDYGSWTDYTHYSLGTKGLVQP